MFPYHEANILHGEITYLQHLQLTIVKRQTSIAHNARVLAGHEMFIYFRHIYSMNV